MGILNYSVTLVNGNPNDAGEVETKFNEVKAVVNGQLDTNNINQATDFTLTGNNQISYLGSMYLGSVHNLGVVNASNQFRITQANGSPLAASTPGWVVVPSTTAGQNVLLKVSSTNILFDYAGAADSDIIGEEFGTTAGVAWGSDRPFFLYAVNVDNTAANLVWAISPNPCATISPAATNNGYLDNPAATPSDINFFFLTSTNVTASAASKPCVCLGSFRMQKNASDDWTVQTLTASDGFNRFQQNVEFDMPTGQMGAVSGRYFLANGGTAPTFTLVNTVKYYVDRDGFVSYSAYLTNAAGGTAGAGAVAAFLSTPYKAYNHATSLYYMGSAIIVGSSIGTVAVCSIEENTSYVFFTYSSVIVTTKVNLTLAGLAAAGREVYCTVKYKAF